MGFTWSLNAAATRRAASELPDRFVDVNFRSLVHDPVGAVGSAYALMGREFTDDHAEMIDRYIRDKPQGKFGVHKYEPEDWGYTAAELRDDLAGYIEAYAIELEETT